MPLVDLGKLKLGDVLLERGDETLARNTGKTVHRFGHASLVLGPLVRIHAQKAGKPAVVEPLIPTHWRRRADGDIIVAVLVPDAAAVMRPRGTVIDTTVVAEAQWLAGQPYAALEKLARLPNLSDRLQTFLQSPAAARLASAAQHKPVPPSAAGLSCGELVASALLGVDSNLSPNDLFEHSDLMEIQDAVYPEDGWECEREDEHAKEVREVIAKYEQNTAPRLWAQAEAIGPDSSPSDRDALAARLERELEEALKRNFAILGQLGDLASATIAYL
jgi:hypothetical protein